MQITITSGLQCLLFTLEVIMLGIIVKVCFDYFKQKANCKNLTKCTGTDTSFLNCTGLTDRTITITITSTITITIIDTDTDTTYGFYSCTGG